MNERIKEIAEQTGLEFDDDESLEFGKQIYYVTKEDMEKFAQLIVRQVFTKIENERFEIYEPVKESVMKHFGVEE